MVTISFISMNHIYLDYQNEALQVFLDILKVTPMLWIILTDKNRTKLSLSSQWNRHNHRAASLLRLSTVFRTTLSVFGL